MTVMANIGSGSRPGGPAAVKAEIMEIPSFTGDAGHDPFERVLQQGTFNCNLPSTAAGVAALKIVAAGEATEYSNRMGQVLRDGLSDVMKRRGAPGAIYGECSVFHIMLGEGMAEAAAGRDVTKLMGRRG